VVTENPWVFGTAHVLTIVGLLLTAGIAFLGFRSFDRWKREQLEARKIEVAFGALKVAYQAKHVFENIRAPLVYPYEYDDMAERPGDTPDKRGRRGEYYAVLNRIKANKAFFEAVWDIQPACAAVFGPGIEDVFLELHRALREIEVACEMLARHLDDPQLNPDPNGDLWQQLRADAAEGILAKEGDRVGRRLAAFRAGIEAKCRPVVDRKFGKESRDGR
jgi:hypothetical protein